MFVHLCSPLSLGLSGYHAAPFCSATTATVWGFCFFYLRRRMPGGQEGKQGGREKALDWFTRRKRFSGDKDFVSKDSLGQRVLLAFLNDPAQWVVKADRCPGTVRTPGPGRVMRPWGWREGRSCLETHTGQFPVSLNRMFLRRDLFIARTSVYNISRHVAGNTLLPKQTFAIGSLYMGSNHVESILDCFLIDRVGSFMWSNLVVTGTRPLQTPGMVMNRTQVTNFCNLAVSFSNKVFCLHKPLLLRVVTLGLHPAGRGGGRVLSSAAAHSAATRP